MKANSLKQNKNTIDNFACQKWAVANTVLLLLRLTGKIESDNKILNAV